MTFHEHNNRKKADGYAEYITGDNLRRLVAAKVRRYCGEHPGVLDGAAGSGQQAQYIRPSEFRAVEIQAEACSTLLQNYPSAQVCNTSFFLYADGEPQDCTVMNPPFSIKLKDLGEDEKSRITQEYPWKKSGVMDEIFVLKGLENACRFGFFILFPGIAYRKREQQRRKDAPSWVEMLQDGGKNVWEEAQQQMGQAFSAMLSRTQNFRQAMGGLFSAIRQTFVQEMVSKPLAALMGRFAQEGAMWLANGARQVAAQSATSAAVTGIKETETTKNVGMNAIQAAAEAFKAMAGIPYVGPILAVGAAAAAMAAVYGLLGGMGGGGGGSTTTTTRIPSAAGGWDIPAGINPLTQLHENEMVLPAEHAQTIRDMAGQGGGGDTIVINTTGGDFIHKKDLAKLLKQLNRDFKIA